MIVLQYIIYSGNNGIIDIAYENITFIFGAFSLLVNYLSITVGQLTKI